MTGLEDTKRNPVVSSPCASAITSAVHIIAQFVQNMKSYGFALTPLAADSPLMRFCRPPVNPSHASDSITMLKPRDEEDEVAFLAFFAMETMQVPPIIIATWEYSLIEYDAPPSRMEPSMTGTILPDLARVTTGNDTPYRSAKFVNALANTCVAPDAANSFNGRPFVGPVNWRPVNPTSTLATDSSTMRNHTCLNFEPSAAS
mmetsp:Transcript_61502/g.120726  ORF Transcript_61502/g.120726 Transcript_61502/m.120726 type:complete len:202 (-) Transcript_61502:402-1007(-)